LKPNQLLWNQNRSRQQLSLARSTSRAATLEAALASQAAALAGSGERVDELERMLREMVVVHGRTTTLEAAAAEVLRRLLTVLRRLLTVLRRVLTVLRRVLTVLRCKRACRRALRWAA
jgi:dGTP triphosphohydrolase